MNTFLFALNAIMPIVLLIALGYLLKKAGLFGEEFLNKGNSFSFRVLIPAMLFCNIYDLDDLGEINGKAVLFAVAAILLTFFLGCALVLPVTKDNGERGALVQSSFRSNTAVIGVPLSTALFGAQGAAAASVLSAFTIPLFNVFAVITLTIFDKENENTKINLKKLVLGIIRNPLIIAVLLGLAVLGVRSVFVKAGIGFRLKDITFLYDALKKIALCGTPFPLIVLGGKFEFEAVGKRVRSILYGVFMRIVLVPVIILGLAYFFIPDIGGAYFAAYVAAFATPVAVSSAIMAKEMNSDAELAGQIVVFSTLFSIVTLFLIIVFFRSVGIF